jgi:hypothetical protein
MIPCAEIPVVAVLAHLVLALSRRWRLLMALWTVMFWLAPGAACDGV